MKNKILVVGIAVMIVAICSSSINIPSRLSHASGASVTGYSGGCNSCHSKGASGSISLTGLPATIIAGNQYTIGIQITQTSNAKNWGFDLLAGSGTLSTTNSLIGVTAGKNNAYHVSPPSVSGNTYTFSNIIWTAPATPGNATFKFAGLAGTGSGSGGSCYNSKLTVAVVAPTPVKFISFDAISSNNKIDLNWVVSEEINTSSYAVQKSWDGVNFSTLAVISSNQKTSEPQTYSFADSTSNPVSHVYYRVKEVDNDGSISYSVTKYLATFSNQNNYSIKIYPNPLRVGQILKVNYISPLSIQTSFTITNSVGVKVLSSEISVNNGVNEIPLNTKDLAPGIYFLTTNSKQNQNKVLSFIIR